MKKKTYGTFFYFDFRSRQRPSCAEKTIGGASHIAALLQQQLHGDAVCADPLVCRPLRGDEDQTLLQGLNGVGGRERGKGRRRQIQWPLIVVVVVDDDRVIVGVSQHGQRLRRAQRRRAD